MPNTELVQDLQRRLGIHRRTLTHYLGQAAIAGPAYMRPEVPYGIDEARAEIRQLKITLRGWGVPVEDWPDDGADDLPPLAAPEQAGAGISALAGMLDAAGIRVAVAGFRESFELICRQIDRLSAYKDLHDQLHDLQFKCYSPLARGARDFPANTLFLDSLADYEFELQQILNNLSELADHSAVAANERGWIVQLGQAAGLLHTAAEQASKPSLERALFQLGRVLYVHPARINERMKESARDLPLGSLRKAMLVVQPAQPDMPAATAARLQQGVAALDQLEADLAGLIESHDSWQDIDLELYRIDEQIEQQIEQLNWLWIDLQPRIAALCAGQPDRWTRDLQQALARFEQALAGDQQGAIVGAFRPFRRMVGLCFFQADKRLKEFCRTLRRVDGPLQAAIGVML